MTQDTTLSLTSTEGIVAEGVYVTADDRPGQDIIKNPKTKIVKTKNNLRPYRAGCKTK